MKLLILNKDATYIKEKLGPQFPELTIHDACIDLDFSGAAREGTPEYDKLLRFIEAADILLTIKLPDHLMQKAKNLQWIQCLITGVDFIVQLPSFRKDIILTSTKGIHGPQMSELAFMLMLNLTRNYPQMLHNQEQKVWDRWTQPLLLNKSVGILGVGAIGKEIARKCKAFGMTVYGITSRKRDIENVDHSYGPEGLVEVMGAVDYFINVLPNTPETKKIIRSKELSAMKPTAFFINIGRGDTVDEDALYKVLKSGKIAAAGLDVFSTEPLPKESPFWDLDNVLITPHVGGFSNVYADQALPIFEENLKRFLKGERRDLINFIELK